MGGMENRYCSVRIAKICFCFCGGLDPGKGFSRCVEGNLWNIKRLKTKSEFEKTFLTLDLGIEVKVDILIWEKGDFELKNAKLVLKKWDSSCKIQKQIKHAK